MEYDIDNIINLLSKPLPMNFFNMLSSGASLFNFNLQSLTSNLGLSPTLQVSTSKAISPQLIAQPSPVLESEQASRMVGDECEGRESKVQLFTKQQQLINQFMHLNIQLLSKKLSNLEQIEKLPKAEEGEPQTETKSNKKKIKKANNCGHPEKQHYAKGMCGNCYHKYGRNKKPWNCPHDKLYANGMCQNCYINSYNRKRREGEKAERDEAELQSELKEEENL